MTGFQWSDYTTFFHPLLLGVRYTLLVTVITMAISMVAAVLVALARLSPWRVLRFVVSAYVEFIRSTPALVQLYYIFYVLPVFHITLSAVMAGIIGLSLIYTAYMSEVYRAAILAVPTTQVEAARSLALSYWQTTRLVILPQAARTALPPTVNYLLSLVKDTSLLSLITIQELMFTGLLLASRTFKYFDILTEVALMYFVICFPLTLLARKLERKLDADLGITPERRRLFRWNSQPVDGVKI